MSLWAESGGAGAGVSAGGKKVFFGLILIKCFLFSLEDQWDESFPEKWLLIPCRYDTLNSGVVCESCPIGYEVSGIWFYQMF